METKKCKKCDETKTLDMFFTHPQCRQGVRPDCKTCATKRSEAWRKANPEKYNTYHRKVKLQYYYEHKNNPQAYEKLRATNNRATTSWQDRNPEKKRAHELVARAIKKGALSRLPCSVCGEEKVEGHHNDYSKPLEVVWFCRAHHAEFHRLNPGVNP